jgi:hypothetical protein
MGKIIALRQLRPVEEEEAKGVWLSHQEIRMAPIVNWSTVRTHRIIKKDFSLKRNLIMYWT